MHFVLHHALLSQGFWNPMIRFRKTIKIVPTRYYGGPQGYLFMYERNHSMEYAAEFILTFSCQFNFENYPFDSQECPIEYGDFLYQTHHVTLNSTRIVYENIDTVFGDDPIIIDDLPFEFQLRAMKTTNKTVAGYTYSYTGVHLTIIRKTMRKLIISYYLPTTFFSLLSMISFLIKPDVVCFLTSIQKNLECIKVNVLEANHSENCGLPLFFLIDSHP